MTKQYINVGLGKWQYYEMKQGNCRKKNRQQKIRQKQSVIVMDNRMEITQNDN